MEADVLVIGAGAAGIIAAWRASQLGARTVLLEKTPRIGTKILISGGGKCNITHDGPIPDLLREFRPSEARFLRPAMYRFPNHEVVRLFNERGIATYTRPNGRVFPVERTAKDVVAVLGKLMAEVGVDLRLDSPVSELIHSECRVAGAIAGGHRIVARSVVVCTGGSSYPGTGTTGDGWGWLSNIGHTIVKVRAALAPINVVTDKEWPTRSGVSLRDCSLKARQDGKQVARWREDLLFTHGGVSGPCALGISREVAEAAGRGAIYLEVDLIPDQSFEEVSEHVRSWSLENPRKHWAALLAERMPERIVPWFCHTVSIDVARPAGSTDKKAKNRIVAGLKGWTLGQVRDVPIEKGEVVAGGVELSEVDAHTMASSKSPNLYLCGEVLDIAGPVGGYNLQAAFSTGFVAGESAAKTAGYGC